MTNYRFSGYLVTALGLINFRYHNGHAHNFQHSIILVIPGLLILGSTFVSKAKPFLASKLGITFISVVVVAEVLWAGINK